MLAENVREANLCTIRAGNTVELSADIFLGNTRFGKTHSCSVHFVANNGSTLKLLYLLLLLGRTHLYNGIDEIHACSFLLLYWMNAKQVEYLNLNIVAIRWQEVYATLQSHGIVAYCLKALHRCRVLYTHALSHIVYAVYAAEPYNIFYVDVVAHKCLNVVVDVDNANKTVAVQTEVI